MFSRNILFLAESVLVAAKAQNLRVMTVESCTGGLIAGALTEIAGSSLVIECGLITYSNESKTQLAGVPAELIVQQGAVSALVAQAMAEGGLQHHAAADMAVAVTGIAGPGGGSVTKPVGTVYIAVARRGVASQVEHHVFQGDRSGIRQQTAEATLKLLIKQISA